MKRHIVLILLILMLSALAGCQSPQPGHYEQITQAVNDGTDSIIEALAVSEAIPKDAIADLTSKIDVIQTASIEAAKVYDEQANTDKLGALIDAAIVANTTTAPVNPYAGPIGGVLAIVAGGYAAIKRKDAITSDIKYRAHKQGAQAFMNKNSGASELYDEIGKARAGKGIT